MLRMALVPDSLDALKYADLRQLAKQCGIKANMKVLNTCKLYQARVSCVLKCAELFSRYSVKTSTEKTATEKRSTVGKKVHGKLVHSEKRSTR